MTMRSRSRSSRSSTNRRGSWPVEITRSTTRNADAPSRAAIASTTSSSSEACVYPSSAAAPSYPSSPPPEPAMSWSSTESVSRTDPPPARTTSGSTPDADGHALAVAELLQVRHQHVRRDQPERVVVGARADGADDLVRLGRREDELDVRRRLLDDLEQRVEALVRDHVRLVEDEDLVAVARGRERGALPQLAGVVDTAVARRVDLDDVQAARAAARQLDARLAHVARGVGGVLLGVLRAVEDAGEDARGRRLAAAARAGEQVRVVDLTAAQRLPQGRGDVVLADHLGEVLGPVAAVQGCRHATNPRRPRRHPRSAAAVDRQRWPASVGAHHRVRQHRPQQRPRGLRRREHQRAARPPGTRRACSRTLRGSGRRRPVPSSGKNMTSAVTADPTATNSSGTSTVRRRTESCSSTGMPARFCSAISRRRSSTDAACAIPADTAASRNATTSVTIAPVTRSSMRIAPCGSCDVSTRSIDGRTASAPATNPASPSPPTTRHAALRVVEQPTGGEQPGGRRRAAQLHLADEPEHPRTDHVEGREADGHRPDERRRPPRHRARRRRR